MGRPPPRRSPVPCRNRGQRPGRCQRRSRWHWRRRESGSVRRHAARASAARGGRAPRHRRIRPSGTTGRPRRTTPRSRRAPAGEYPRRCEAPQRNAAVPGSDGSRSGLRSRSTLRHLPDWKGTVTSNPCRIPNGGFPERLANLRQCDSVTGQGGIGGRLMRNWILALALVLAPASVQAEWFEASSANFVVYADDSERDVRRFSEQLELYHEAMEGMTGLDLPLPSPSNRLTVFVVSSPRE